MLSVIKSMQELDGEQLMAVYRESNRENGKEFFPDHTPDKQLCLAEGRFLDYLRQDFFRQRGALYCLWSDGGRYQSALRLEPYADGLLLQALETAPDARRKGYARALMEATLSYLRQTDAQVVYSHVSKRNFPSLNLHKACGFEVCSDSATYIDGTVTQSSFTLRYKI